MAKSGMYLNGKELLECELDKLNDIDKVKSQLETHIKYESDSQRVLSKSLSVVLTKLKKFD
jgi:hypothetical protein